MVNKNQSVRIKSPLSGWDTEEVLLDRNNNSNVRCFDKKHERKYETPITHQSTTTLSTNFRYYSDIRHYINEYRNKFKISQSQNRQPYFDTMNEENSSRQKDSNLKSQLKDVKKRPTISTMTSRDRAGNKQLLSTSEKQEERRKELKVQKSLNLEVLNSNQRMKGPRCLEDDNKIQKEDFLSRNKGVKLLEERSEKRRQPAVEATWLNEAFSNSAYVGPFLFPMGNDMKSKMASMLITTTANGKQLYFYELPSLHVIGRKSFKQLEKIGKINAMRIDFTSKSFTSSCDLKSHDLKDIKSIESISLMNNDHMKRNFELTQNVHLKMKRSNKLTFPALHANIRFKIEGKSLLKSKSFEEN